MVELKKSLLEYLGTLTSGGVKIKEICESIGLSLEEKEMVLEALRSLEEEGLVYVTKHKEYLLLENSNRIKGTLSIKRQGVGVLLGSKIKLSKDNLNGAISGDVVVVSNNGGSKEYHVERILRRGAGLVTCGIIEDDGHKYALPINDNEFIKIEIDESELDKYKEGDLIAVQIDPSGEGEYYKKNPKRKKKKGIDSSPTYRGRVLRYVGNVDDPDYDMDVIANKHGFYQNYPDEVMEEVKKIPEDISGEDLSGRRDYRKKLIFTIDGDDTKDIDDAISLEILPNGNYLLGVHIADVSHYVKPGSALFREAKRRGTSLYYLDKVAAMLPKELSNKICSLNPDEERLTKTCEMEITPDGRIVKSEVFKSVIKSRKQMTYDAVNRILEDGEIPDGYEDYADTLKEMHSLAQALDRRRKAEGKVDFFSVEPKFKRNKITGKVTAKPNYQRSAENLIENFMVAANYSVAKMFSNLPFIYRVHELGNAFRLKSVFGSLTRLIPGLKVPNRVGNRDIQELMEKVKDTKLFRPLSRLILKCMTKAQYSEKNSGHSGLGLKIYTHFTSPIRRFSDLVVHTLIDLYLSKEFDKKKDDPDFMKDLSYKVAECAAQATAREGEADAAEKQATDMKMAELMTEFIDQEKNGTIMEISQKEIKVVFDEIYEGKVPLTCINGEGKVRVAKDNLSFTKGYEEYTIGDAVAFKVLGTSKKKGEIVLGINGRAIEVPIVKKDKVKSLT